jgi:hypothetical protein
MSARAYPRLRRLPVGQPLDAPAPPAELLPTSYPARLYGMLAPLAQWDPNAAWSLLILVNAIGLPFQLVEDLVRDTPDGPGWSALLDVDRCPVEALPWLGQLAGVRVLPDSSESAMRARIRSTDGFHRGTVAAMRAAALATMSEAGYLVFRERAGDPYVLDVISYADETPDPNATLQALLAQKPGGIVLNYSTATGQTYQVLNDTHASYDDVNATYAYYAAVLLDEPA